VGGGGGGGVGGGGGGVKSFEKEELPFGCENTGLIGLWQGEKSSLIHKGRCFLGTMGKGP